MLVPERRHQRLLAAFFSASPRCRGVGGVHNRRGPAHADSPVGHVGDGLARILAARPPRRGGGSPRRNLPRSLGPIAFPAPQGRAVITVAPRRKKGARDYGQHGPT